MARHLFIFPMKDQKCWPLHIMGWIRVWVKTLVPCCSPLNRWQMDVHLPKYVHDSIVFYRFGMLWAHPGPILAESPGRNKSIKRKRMPMLTSAHGCSKLDLGISGYIWVHGVHGVHPKYLYIIVVIHCVCWPVNLFWNQFLIVLNVLISSDLFWFHTRILSACALYQQNFTTEMAVINGHMLGITQHSHLLQVMSYISARSSGT